MTLEAKLGGGSGARSVRAFAKSLSILILLSFWLQGCQTLQDPPQFGPSTHRPHPDCDARGTRSFADFLHASTLQLLHRDNDLLGRRKLAHRQGKQLGSLARLKFAALIVRTEPLQCFLAKLGEADFIAAAALFAQVIQRNMDSNSGKPM